MKPNFVGDENSSKTTTTTAAATRITWQIQLEKHLNKVWRLPQALAALSLLFALSPSLSLCLRPCLALLFCVIYSCRLFVIRIFNKLPSLSARFIMHKLCRRLSFVCSTAPATATTEQTVWTPLCYTVQKIWAGSSGIVSYLFYGYFSFDFINYYC